MEKVHVTVSSNLYEKVKTFKYLGYLLTNRDSVREEVSCRLKVGNSCYYSVPTLLYSRHLRIRKLKIYKTIILPVIINGTETWTLTLRE